MGVGVYLGKNRTMQFINEELLNTTTQKAQNSERKRMNYNFHPSMESDIHRLLNALEPDTYIRPHRHKGAQKEETLLVLKGKLIFFSFDDSGKVTEALLMGPETDCHGVELNASDWHALISLESGTVIYEVKKGPFTPLGPEDVADWSPDGSNNEEANRYKEFLMCEYNRIQSLNS